MVAAVSGGVDGVVAAIDESFEDTMGLLGFVVTGVCGVELLFSSVVPGKSEFKNLAKSKL